MTELATRTVRATPRNMLMDPWRQAVALIVLCSGFRLVYLVCLSPYELVGDEAYYWVQSQHLDWSYREKGPLLAWAIAGCCQLFGNVEWAVRLPVWLAWSVTAWGVGRLTLSVTPSARQAAFLAVAAFLIAPAFQANAQICTQDGPLMTLLVALTEVGLRLTRRWEAGQNIWLEWLLFWALLGVGVLLKQSVLLFGTAIVSYIVIRWRQLPWKADLAWQQLAGGLLFIAIISPVLFWEQRQGWPMLAHTLGHLGLGVDHATKPHMGGPVSWVCSTVGSMIGGVGPGYVALSLWATAQVILRRHLEPDRWPARLWILCAVWPSVLFFVGLSGFKAVVPSWPLPSLVPLAVLVGEFSTREEMAKGAVGVRRWLRLFWQFQIIYGLVALMLMLCPMVIRWQPFARAEIDDLLSRISGSRSEAEIVDAAALQTASPDGRLPIVVTPHYQKASLYTFYLSLEGEPVTVTSAGGIVGGRPSNFDHWDGTRLTNPIWRGRNLVIVGGDRSAWQRLLIVDDIRVIVTIPTRTKTIDLFLATNFQGPRVRRSEVVRP